MSRKLTVLVVFGGRSTEHQVSIRSAASIINALEATCYDVIPVCISRAGKWLSPAESAKLLPQGMRPMVLTSSHIIGDGNIRSLVEITSSEARSPLVDVVFPVLHGTYGEDGTVQGLLELADIPYVGCGVLASAVGMDKHMTKQLLMQAGLATPEFMIISRVDWRKHRDEMLVSVHKTFRMPVFTKPANSGSSVGIRKAHNSQELPVCLDEAFTYDSKALVEETIVGRELECSVLGNESPRASIVGEVIPGAEYYDYAEKYLRDTTKLIIPAKLPNGKSDELRQMAVKAFQAIGGEGLARVDFFMEKKTNRLLVNELNTLPGFTSISMYPKMWEATGLGYSELVDELIRLAMERHKDRASNKLSYES